MMMYDVAKKHAAILEGLENVKSWVEADQVDGIVFVIRMKDKSHQHALFTGEVNVFEWIGGLESLKNRLIRSIETF